MYRVITVAPAGAGLHVDPNRWLAPPAKVRCPAGTNSADALKGGSGRGATARWSTGVQPVLLESD